MYHLLFLSTPQMHLWMIQLRSLAICSINIMNYCCFFFIYLSLFLQFLCSCFVVVVFVLWFSGEWTTQRTPQSVTIDCKILLRSNVNFLRSIWRLFGWQGQRERVFVTLCICVRLCMSVLHVCWCVTRCAFAECLNSASTYVGMTVWLYLLCMWMY